MDDYGLTECDSVKLALYFATRDLFLANRTDLDADDIPNYMGWNWDEGRPLVMMQFRFSVTICVELSSAAAVLLRDMDVPLYTGPAGWVPVNADLHTYFYMLTKEGVQRLATMAENNPGLAKSLGL